MATTERRVDTADRRVRAMLPSIGEELRSARMSAGLSLARVGELVGRSHAHVGRVERGHEPAIRVRDLVRIGQVVGLDVSIRFYPRGVPVRDAGQLALLERFRAAIDPALRWRVEAPVERARDGRAFDALITGAGEPIAVEAETRIRDLQALERRVALKCRDGGIGRVVLLVKRSEANGLVLAGAGSSFWSMFPIPGVRARRALREGRDPGGSTVVVM